ncbi:lytic murein transglycosylase [Micromonospora sp. DT4]|uniref:lytic transglycosylase domain-containing protein n=1 Tax=Micromonospora sp. DT4 TaxID=3393438 RepID=UPI003CF4F5A6
MVDGEDKTRVQPLRPAAPLDGPLAESGAAPDPAPAAVPRPRRPWLRSGTTDPKTTTPAAADAATAADPIADTAKTGDGTATAGATATELTATKVDGVAVVPAVPPGRRRRVPFAHAVRLPPPRQAAVSAARATRAWSRRPSGRLTVPGVFLLALVTATAAAGALLVPATIRGSEPVAVDASAAPTVAVPPALPLDPRPTGPLPSGAVPTGAVPTGALPTGAFPTGGMPTGPAVGPTVGGRPSDALAGWAQQVGAQAGIPPAAMQAYGYAELVLAQTNRSCALSWTTLAAIGQIESGHGSANGARLGPDGKALPQIIGLPLDGTGGRMRIIDTDHGSLDNDSTYDRAIGPMQFIPTTWQEIGADADRDGVKDPHDLDDAALAAGNYLCKGGRNLSIPGDWWNAILSYNDVRRYAQAVYTTADRYGRASRR